MASLLRVAALCKQRLSGVFAEPERANARFDGGDPRRELLLLEQRAQGPTTSQLNRCL